MLCARTTCGHPSIKVGTVVGALQCAPCSCALASTFTSSWKSFSPKVSSAFLTVIAIVSKGVEVRIARVLTIAIYVVKQSTPR
jgi:hypothetical protein